MVKTSGGGTPVAIHEDCLYLPEWSPGGEWIACSSEAGWSLISPDGKASQSFGQFDTYSMVFSKDGKKLYGILIKDPKTNRDSAILFSLDIATHEQTMIKDLGIEYQPATNVNPGYRCSMSPDGTSFVYSTGKYRQDIWMLQGFKQRSWLDSFSLH